MLWIWFVLESISIRCARNTYPRNEINQKLSRWIHKLEMELCRRNESVYESSFESTASMQMFGWSVIWRCVGSSVTTWHILRRNRVSYRYILFLSRSTSWYSYCVFWWMRCGGDRYLSTYVKIVVLDVGCLNHVWKMLVLVNNWRIQALSRFVKQMFLGILPFLNLRTLCWAHPFLKRVLACWV